MSCRQCREGKFPHRHGNRVRGCMVLGLPTIEPVHAEAPVPAAETPPTTNTMNVTKILIDGKEIAVKSATITLARPDGYAERPVMSSKGVSGSVTTKLTPWETIRWFEFFESRGHVFESEI